MEQGKYPNPSEEHETITKGEKLKDQVQNKILDAPLDATPPNGQAVKKVKPPNSSKEQEPMGKEITLRDQIQKKILDALLNPIPPNGQVL